MDAEATPSTFTEFQKIPRLSRMCTITEKCDGTNLQICITDAGEFLVGSRRRYITPEDDNYGAAKWAYAHKDELLQLGPGKHFGEWFGSGIQRGYGLPAGDKRFLLFNVNRWCLYNEEPKRIDMGDPKIERYQTRLPACVGLVPVLARGIFTTELVDQTMEKLRTHGSFIVPFMDPEGIVIFHEASRTLFKKTFKGDEVPKSKYTKEEAS
jgi:hypothetical protein